MTRGGTGALVLVVSALAAGGGCVKGFDAGTPGAAGPAYLDPSRSVEDRVADLVGRMTLDEKIGQMVHDAAAIPRLGIPAYNWWNEALHGVARAGTATVFPQAIALAATFDEPFMGRVATAISDEARAKHHQAVRDGERGIYQGLTFFSPNVNIFRDPRWGRGHETFGEDPFLSARMGVAFIKGMQGDDPRYLKTAATVKHFAVHSGPEVQRHGFDARVSDHDLFDTYLPQFEACVREGRVRGVMPAYNRLGGLPCCASPPLLETILRGRWGFDGFVVTDCGAIEDVYKAHGFSPTPEHAVAATLKAGTDLNCGTTFSALKAAAAQGLVTEAEIDRAVSRLFSVRFRLGMFDPPDQVRYAQIPITVNDSPEHRALAREAARRSMVLLKNEGGVLPIAAGVRKIAVIGPTADDRDVLLGNYHGTPSESVTVLEGIRARAKAQGAHVTYARGCKVAGRSKAGIPEAVALAREAELVVVVAGLSPHYEGEEGERQENPGGDRRDIRLPGMQERLLEAVAAVGKPMVLVLTGGSALAIGWAKEHVPAILMAWYPGEEGGSAVADLLWGDASPAGRLPVTFYRSAHDLPPFDDYAMRGRTYRYFTGEPLFAFGHGLSYTTFSYRALTLAPDRIEAGANASLRVEVEVANTGPRAGDEVVQVYLTHHPEPPPPAGTLPVRALAALRRVHLGPGESQRVVIDLDARALSFVDAAGRRVISPGAITLSVGGAQPDARNAYAAGAGVTGRVEIAGESVAI